MSSIKIFSAIVFLLSISTLDASFGFHENSQASSSSLNELSPHERSAFAAQLEGKQTDNPDYWRADGANSTLRQVLAFIRHGDRTPTVFPPRDPLRDEPFWQLHGLGQLTSLGKARQSLLGRLMRYRYDSFLCGSVSKQIQTARSSGFSRCIESAQAFLSSFLALSPPNSTDAPYLQWDIAYDNPTAHLWQPVNVLTSPIPMDGMLAYSNCRVKMENDQVEVEQSENFRRIIANLATLDERLSTSIGLKFDTYKSVVYAADLALSESLYFPDKMDRSLKEAEQELTDATDLVYAEIQRPNLSRRLSTGLVVNDILSNMRLTQLGQTKETSKFIHYSSHDLNLSTLLGDLGLWPQVNKRPNYSANLVLELHEQQSGWFVHFFYMHSVPSDWREFKMPHCKQTDLEGRCSLDEVEQLLDKYRLTSWQQWMSECNNDYSSLHLYG